MYVCPNYISRSRGRSAAASMTYSTSIVGVGYSGVRSFETLHPPKLLCLSRRMHITQLRWDCRPLVTEGLTLSNPNRARQRMPARSHPVDRVSACRSLIGVPPESTTGLEAYVVRIQACHLFGLPAEAHHTMHLFSVRGLRQTYSGESYPKWN